MINPNLRLENIEITGPITPEFAEILTPEAISFVATLVRAFADRREELLQRRVQRQAEINAGKLPDSMFPKLCTAARKPKADPRNSVGESEATEACCDVSTQPIAIPAILKLRARSTTFGNWTANPRYASMNNSTPIVSTNVVLLLSPALPAGTLSSVAATL